MTTERGYTRDECERLSRRAYFVAESLPATEANWARHLWWMRDAERWERRAAKLRAQAKGE